MKIKSVAQAQKPKTKMKVNKKRLFFIFFSAFVGFFFLCTLIASMLTPKIDVPALNDENNLSSVSSDDFKGRIDPRLRTLEMDAGPANTASPENPFLDKTNTDQSEVDINSYQNDQGYTEPEPQGDYSEQLPYDGRESEMQDPGFSESYPQETVQPKTQPQKTVKQAPKKDVNQQEEDLILRDKVKVQHEPSSINKVMVGSYTDLTEARKVSQELTDSNLNVTPFIREVNGAYSLQVGTFSNPQKAAKLAGDLRKRNLAPRIIQD